MFHTSVVGDFKSRPNKFDFRFPPVGAGIADPDPETESGGDDTSSLDFATIETSIEFSVSVPVSTGTTVLRQSSCHV
jgi:hypothetical protein